MGSLSCEGMQFWGSIINHFVIAGGEPQLNRTIATSFRGRNNVHIRQCSNIEGSGARARFCCGFAGEDTECCSDSAALFQLSSVAANGDDGQGDALGAQNISPLPTTKTPPMSLVAPLTMSSKAPVSVAAVSAAPTTQAQQLTISASSSAVTAVLEMANSDGSGVRDMTVTFGGDEDTLLIATDVPPLLPVNVPAASATGSTASASDSTASQTLVASAAGHLDLPLGSSTESAEYSQRLSRGAIVAVGVGLSLAGAGLVAMTVFVIARRRVYKRQEKKWREHMQAVQAPKENTGSGGGLDLSTGGGSAMRAYANSPMSYANCDIKPGLERQATTMMQLSVPKTPSTSLYPGMEGPSPVSVYLREMGWREGSNADSPSVDNHSYYSQGSLRVRDADSQGVATYRSDIESPSARSPGLKPTASWLGRHSIYEMP